MADRKVERAPAEFHAGVSIVPVTLTPAASVTITKADHSGRLCLIPSTATGNDEYVLPTALRAGESYRFCFSGNAADADDIIFKSSAADGLTFTGGILSSDEDDTNAAAVIVVLPGGDDDILTLVDPSGFDIMFTATTTTNYHVTGWASSTGTHAAWGDQ
mgnify:CR=1 FL=1